MPLTTQNTAALIVDAFESRKAERIAIEEANVSDWSDPERGRAFVDLIRGVRAWVAHPNVVAASAPDTEDGRIWGYAAASLLDAAASEFDLGDGAEIVELSPTMYTLNW